MTTKSHPARPENTPPTDAERLQAMGGTPEDVQALNALTLQGIDLNKILTFVVGLLRLLQDTFGATATQAMVPMKAPAPDQVEKAKALGLPADLQKFPFERIINFIRFILGIFASGGGPAATTSK